MRRLLLRLLPSQLRASLRALDRIDVGRLSMLVRAYIGRRGDPRRLRAAFASERNRLSVLLVCHGNIYRSAFAHVALEQALSRRGAQSLVVRSAGLRTSAGRPVPQDAIAVAKAFGVPLDGHRSTPLTKGLVETADLVVAMDYANCAILRATYPDAKARIVMLGSFAAATSDDGFAIPDPYGADAAELQSCFTRVYRAVTIVAEAVPTAASASRDHMAGSVLRAKALTALTSPIAMRVWEKYTNGAASILMMHRFADRELGIGGHDPSLLAQHLEYLRRRRYNLSSLRDLVERMRAGERPLPRTVVFTVDDGYADFARVAAPIFALFECPVSVFLVTGFLDGECWMWPDRVRELLGEVSTGRWSLRVNEEVRTFEWSGPDDRDNRLNELIYALSLVPDAARESFMADLERESGRSLPMRPPVRYGPMSWSDVHRLSAAGVDFGAHSRRHPVLSRVSASRARLEIEDSWMRLRGELPSALPVFCYPNGLRDDFTAEDRLTVERLGLTAAVAAYGGSCTEKHFERDRFALPRFTYEQHPERLRQLVGGFERLKTESRALFGRVDPR